MRVGTAIILVYAAVSFLLTILRHYQSMILILETMGQICMMVSYVIHTVDGCGSAQETDIVDSSFSSKTWWSATAVAVS